MVNGGVQEGGCCVVKVAVQYVLLELAGGDAGGERRGSVLGAGGQVSGWNSQAGGWC